MLEIFVNIISALAIILICAMTIVELRRDLMMLQQNSYRRERYLRWLKASGDTTSMMRIAGYFLFLFAMAGFNIDAATMTFISFLGIYGLVKLLKAKYKKPLAMTGRAKRLFSVQLTLSASVIAVAIILFGQESLRSALYAAAVAAVGCYCAAHIITIAALFVLQPVEKSINRKFYNAAAEKLTQMPDLKIIGITGSYGKTSTKHYLHRILSEHFDTIITPGSYNTTLGVVRTINEMLKPYNQVFIVEMGAKQRGDIAEICNLVHPRAAIVTAVGPQHLETFKTIQNVCDTKFELVDALPADGLAVINNDFSPIARRNVSNTNVQRYGISSPEGCDYKAIDIKYTPMGTDFTVTGAGPDLRLHTSLVGECNISNLLAAVAIARHLGVPDSKIQYAVSRIQQVEHRLSIKQAGTLTIIDDAFNSNPAGSKMALDVLAMMSGTRFVITPGMIELGEEQFDRNYDFGAHMAHCADIAMVVGHYNRDAITQGLVSEGMPAEKIMHFDTFSEAYTHMLGMHRPGDTILIENDLPDTFK